MASFLSRPARSKLAPVATGRSSILHQRGVEFARTALRHGAGHGEGRGQAPVLGGDERHSLALPLHDDAGGDALHAARRQPRLDLLPQHRRHFVAVEPVQDASRLLGVDQPAVDVARRLDCRPDRRSGDLVEHHPLHVDPLGRLQHLLQVPGNRLSLAVLVGRQIQDVRLGEQFPELGDLLALVGSDHVERFEAVLDVDAESRPRLILVLLRNGRRALRQVAHVADGGFHDVFGAEVSGDGVRLGRRFNDDEGRWHVQKIRPVPHRVSTPTGDGCSDGSERRRPLLKMAPYHSSPQPRARQGRLWEWWPGRPPGRSHDHGLVIGYRIGSVNDMSPAQNVAAGRRCP